VAAHDQKDERNRERDGNDAPLPDAAGDPCASREPSAGVVVGLPQL